MESRQIKQMVRTEWRKVIFILASFSIPTRSLPGGLPLLQPAPRLPEAPRRGLRRRGA